MSLHLVEGWGLINDQSLVSQKYSNVSGTFAFSTQHRVGNRSLVAHYQDTANKPHFRIPLTVDQSYTIGMSMRWQGNIGNFEGGLQEFVGFYRNGLRNCYVAWDTPEDTTNFKGRFVDGNGSSDIMINTFPKGAWHYLEIYVKAGTSTPTGQYEVRINQTPVLTGSTNTAGSGSEFHDEIRITGLLGGSGVSEAGLISDLYIADGKTFLGNVAVEPIVVLSDDAVEWANSTGFGSNYTHIDDVVPDDDTTYIYNTGSDTRDLYGIRPLQVLESNIYAVNWGAQARLTVTGSSRNLKSVWKMVSTEADGPGTHVVNTDSYDHKGEILVVNPVTGLAWTVGDFNTLKMGVKSV